MKLFFFYCLCPQKSSTSISYGEKFVYGVAVTDYNFTGREEETHRLKSNFTNVINSILISPRRWEKTSLVYYVCRQLEGTYIITVRLAFIVLIHTPQGEAAKEELLPSAIKEMISTNEALYMQQIEPLTGYQMNLLCAIVSGIHAGFNEKKVRSQLDLGTPSNLVRLRDALIERDLIYSEMR